MIWPWFIASGPITALTKHQGSSSAHFGPSLSSQLFLGTDLRPKQPSRGPNEPEIVYLGYVPSDMTVVYRFWAHYSPPTTSGELFRPFWTKFELSIFLVSDLGPKHHFLEGFFGRKSVPKKS